MKTTPDIGNLDRQIADIRQQIQTSTYQEDQRLVHEQKYFRDEIERLKGYIIDLEKSICKDKSILST